MSDEFVIDKTRLEAISKAFGISIESVRDLHNEFVPLEEQIKDHRLTHISRVLESYFKKLTRNNGFYIEYLPYMFHTARRRGAASLYNPFKKFIVCYDNTRPEREIRVNISHELGHLFLLAKSFHSVTGEFKVKYGQSLEPLSSIFGLFIVSNKNHYFENLHSTGQMHNDWQELLDDFKKFCV